MNAWPFEISAALNPAMDQISFLTAPHFLVPSPARDVSYKTSTARGMYLSLWEGARLGSRETSVSTVCFSSWPPYLILADSQSRCRPFDLTGLLVILRVAALSAAARR